MGFIKHPMDACGRVRMRPGAFRIERARRAHRRNSGSYFEDELEDESRPWRCLGGFPQPTAITFMAVM